MPRQKTVTAHGEVEYESETCAGCGMEYLPEDVEVLYWDCGEVEPKYHARSDDVKYWKLKSEPKEIVMCENCTDRPQKLTLPKFGAGVGLGVVIGFVVGLFVIVALLGLL